MALKRSGFKPYAMKPCVPCGGERPHTAAGKCVSCDQRAKATTPGRRLYQRARALQRAKKAAAKPRVSPTKQAAKAALPIAAGLVKRRAKGMCEWCGMPCPQGHVHHRRPRQAGGTGLVATNSASNLLWLHPECHEHIEDRKSVV